jgi:hypothetical protein
LTKLMVGKLDAVRGFPEVSDGVRHRRMSRMFTRRELSAAPLLCNVSFTTGAVLGD